MRAHSRAPPEPWKGPGPVRGLVFKSERLELKLL